MTSLPTATAKAIPGFPGYAVDVDGTVWSCWIGGPKARPEGPWKKKKSYIGVKNKYSYVTLRHDIDFTLHTLVLLAFVGPAPEGMECRHIDGNKRNNVLSNLKWGTRQENSEDKIRHGTVCCGSRHREAKVTEADVKEIRLLADLGVSRKELSERFGLNQSNISMIVNRKSWKHVA